MAQIIGQAFDRIDGPAKATGAAPYAGDVKADRMAFGVIVTATIGCGRITGINTDMARQMPGVLLVMTHQNAPHQAPFQPKGEDRHAHQARGCPRDDARAGSLQGCRVGRHRLNSRTWTER